MKHLNGEKLGDPSKVGYALEMGHTRYSRDIDIKCDRPSSFPKVRSHSFDLSDRQIRQTTAKPGNLNHRIAGILETRRAIIQRQEGTATIAKGGCTVGNKATVSQHRAD